MTIQIAPSLASTRAKSVRRPTLRPQGRLVPYLADRQRRQQTRGWACWHDPAKIGKALGLSGADLQAEVEQAERLGLIESKTLEQGLRVTLSGLAWTLFGLDSRNRGDVPHSSFSEFDHFHDHVKMITPEGSTPDLVGVLIGWPGAIVLVDDLANRLGRDPEPVWDELLALQEAGAVSLWPDHPAGPAAMISGLTAERLGLYLASDGSRWLRVWQEDPTTIDPDPVDLTEADLSLDPDRPDWLDDQPDPEALEGFEVSEATEANDATIFQIEEMITDPKRPRPVVLEQNASVGRESNRIVRLSDYRPRS